METTSPAVAYGRSSPEMNKTVREGGSKGSNGFNEHQWITKESLEESVELERL